MDELEKVEKLREKTGVTYEDAKKALEETNWNLLDAIVQMEKAGKVKKPQMDVYTTRTEESDAFKKASDSYEQRSERKTVGEMADRFIQFCARLIKSGCENFFEVEKNGKQIISIPVLVLVLLFIIGFWTILALLVVGLFFDMHYSFRGPMKAGDDLNQACEKASQKCGDIKSEIAGKEEE